MFIVRIILFWKYPVCDNVTIGFRMYQEAFINNTIFLNNQLKQQYHQRHCKYCRQSRHHTDCTCILRIIPINLAHLCHRRCCRCCYCKKYYQQNLPPFCMSSNQPADLQNQKRKYRYSNQSQACYQIGSLIRKLFFQISACHQHSNYKHACRAYHTQILIQRFLSVNFGR